MSGGDDNVVRLYDVASEKEVISYSEHKVLLSSNFKIIFLS